MTGEDAVPDSAASEAPGDDDGFARLTARIRAEHGFDCDSYKERCLRRRVAVRMRARGVHSFDDYSRVLDGDASEWERLLDALTINVTRLFRDRETFEALAARVVPQVWRSGGDELRVWSAGCSSGEEAYSLAALFHRHAEAEGELSALGRLRILGTDIDRASLAAARAGCFAESAFLEAPPALRARYFAGGPPACASDELRALVRFEHRDLLRDEPPPGPLHLIACRNVLIYFDRATQERLLAAFRDALAPGGFLVLGRVEMLLGASRQGMVPVVPRDRIYRRA